MVAHATHRILQFLPFSQAYPTIAGGHIVVFVVSVLFLDERVTLTKVGGMVLIAAGVPVIAKA